MQELTALRQRVESHDFQGAIVIITELEVMYLEAKLNTIHLYLVNLMLHLIMQDAEDRSTRAWERSIMSSVNRIKLINRRRMDGGYYVKPRQLGKLIDEAYPEALQEASFEVFEGEYSHVVLNKIVEPTQIKLQATALLDFNK